MSALNIPFWRSIRSRYSLPAQHQHRHLPPDAACTLPAQTCVHVQQGRVWITHQSKDFVVCAGETFTPQPGQDQPVIQALGNQPATIELRPV